MTASLDALGAPAPASTSPLSAAYTSLGRVLPILRVSEEPPRGGPGWTRGSELAEGGAALDGFLAQDAAQIERDHGRPGRPDVIAGFGLHRYAWPVALLFTIPYFLLRRVPVLTPGDVSFHRGEGLLTVRPAAFHCLPGDPAAGHPLARTVPGEEALRAAVRRSAADHLAPLLDAFGSRMRRRNRALWGMVTDELAEGLWYVGGLLGQERRAREEAALLLPGGTAPYAGRAGFRELPGPGGERPATRDRVSCCLFYTLRPDETCLTCPRTCDADRIERISGNR